MAKQLWIADRNITIAGVKRGDYYGDSNHDGNSTGNGVAMHELALATQTGVVCTVSGSIVALYNGYFSAKATRISDATS